MGDEHPVGEESDSRRPDDHGDDPDQEQDEEVDLVLLPMTAKQANYNRRDLWHNRQQPASAFA